MKRGELSRGRTLPCRSTGGREVLRRWPPMRLRTRKTKPLEGSESPCSGRREANGRDRREELPRSPHSRCLDES